MRIEIRKIMKIGGSLGVTLGPRRGFEIGDYVEIEDRGPGAVIVRKARIGAAEG